MSTFSIHPNWDINGALPIAETTQPTMICEVSDSNMLNEEQLATIQTLPGHHIINAAAGTGKSLSLIARMVVIGQQAPSSNILMISFTKRSAMELRERIGSAPHVRVSTFHSLSYHILTSAGLQFTVDTNAAMQESIIRKLIGRKNTTPEDFLHCLHRGVSDNPVTLAVYSKYLSWLRTHRIVTFDTMQIAALELLRKDTGLRSYWQNRYDFWLVDEYQDVDSHQQQLIALLSERSGNLTVVGDKRQSIYSFRGSLPDAMDRFSVNEATCYQLRLNYRSNSAILGLANQVMANYRPLIAAKMEEPIYPQYLTARDASEEAIEVVAKIKELHSKGMAYRDMTILFRSSAACSAVIETLLTQQVPAVSRAATSLQTSRMPYAGIIKLFRFIQQPDSLPTFRAILPILYIRKGQLPEITKLAQSESCSLLTAVQKLPLPFFHLEYLAELAAAIQSAADMAPKEATLHLLQHGYSKYIGPELTASVQGMADKLAEHPSITAYLAHIDEQQERLNAMRQLSASSEDYLQLMTIHAAKGMEWNTVFLIGAYDGCIPSNRDEADLEEERRLLYVAITRAKERLYISYPRLNEEQHDPNQVSRFLREAFSIQRE